MMTALRTLNARRHEWRITHVGAQHGFSLLEVLVTVVVVSVGLLGILGLQTASIANTRISASRSAATVAADNFVARMRANPEGDYDDIASITNIENFTTTDLPDCDDGSPCSVDNITKHDVYQWSLTLQRKLPDGYGFVDCVDSTCSAYRITVAWTEHDPASSDQTPANGNAVDLCDDGDGHQITDRCFITEVRP